MQILVFKSRSMVFETNKIYKSNYIVKKVIRIMNKKGNKTVKRKD